MLCRLIIVDDEQHIRNGLKKMIDWQSIGYDLVGDFSDGSDVLEYMKDNAVDIILTDIKMKNVSGIDLAERLYYDFPEVMIVFLSAYNDFEYAQKAINYNVVGYLLKTSTTEEITHFMKDVVNKVKRKSYLKFDDNLKKDDILYRREQIAEKILEGKYDTIEQFSEELLSVKIPLSLKDSTITIFTMNAEEGYQNWKYGLDGFYNVIRNFFFYFIEEKAYFLCKMDNPAYVVLLSSKPREVDYIKTLEKNMSSTLKIDVKLSVLICNEKIIDIIETDDLLSTNSQNTLLVQKIIDFIKGNIGNKLSVHDVSVALNYSSAHLGRIFKKETGKTLNNYIIETKMTEAMRLLKEGLYVYEVCERVGYKSLQFFGRNFKEFSGVTPLEYRTKVQKKV